MYINTPAVEYEKISDVLTLCKQMDTKRIKCQICDTLSCDKHCDACNQENCNVHKIFPIVFNNIFSKVPNVKHILIPPKHIIYFNFSSNDTDRNNIYIDGKITVRASSFNNTNIFILSVNNTKNLELFIKTLYKALIYSTALTKNNENLSSLILNAESITINNFNYGNEIFNGGIIDVESSIIKHKDITYKYSDTHGNKYLNSLKIGDTIRVDGSIVPIRVVFDEIEKNVTFKIVFGVIVKTIPIINSYINKHNPLSEIYDQQHESLDIKQTNDMIDNLENI